MRRDLNFERLGDAVGEARSLLESGYTQAGNWTLGQVCRHMRLTIESNMQGYPGWMSVLGYPLRPLLRRFALPMLLAGNSPKGIRTAGMFVPPANLDDAQEVDRFQECVAAFLASDHPMHPHPGFGAMTNEGFHRFHAAHAAHHLGFLHPNNAERGGLRADLVQKRG